MEKNVKILTVYHKEIDELRASFLLPLHVGSSSSVGTLRDDDGDNISHKNPTFNEMTALYWAWKHYEVIGDPDFLGLCHYRRFFLFENRKYPYYECDEFADVDEAAFSEAALQGVLSSNSIVAPMRTKRRSVGGSYASAHHKEDLFLMLDILKERSPEILPYANKYLDSDGIYYYNMFVFEKSVFFDYAEWIFPILDEFEEKTSFKGERLFISEILTGIYLYRLKTSRPDFVELPVIFIAGKKQPLKAVLREVKSNFKNKKSGVLYNFRPLILWLAPKKLMLKRRQRRVK
ncbi:MAG: DUF4422 domain-containing protein [Clostridia bacterium]|nr:DUF4422 domain-containing protein [Clostridia bacterium]